MWKEPKQPSNLLETATHSATIRALVFCLGGANDLGGQLREVLESSRRVEIAQQELPDVHGVSTIVPGVLAKFQPTVLLLCVADESVPSTKVIFETVNKGARELSIIAILKKSTTEQLQRLFGMGAADFCLAPVTLEDLFPRMLRWSVSSEKENILARHLGLQQILGESPVFLEALSKVPKLARSDASVFISGETGTGKEMCARAIHHLGPRAAHPFVPVNCGAIPSELVENELFGHEAGAFTSAASTSRGLVHVAEGGTLFLDEIDSLPPHTQVKFLRFLQDQEYRPLGGRKTSRADIRIIAAANSDLEEAVRSRRFRSDLFYRLNVLPLKLPPLRQRPEDIPLLAHHFLRKYSREFSVSVKELTSGAMEKLLSYDWPGNVRELQNIIERAIVLSEQAVITGTEICLPHVPRLLEDASFKTLKARAIAEFESAYIRQMLATNDGNISKAARAAKKNRRAFWQLMRKHEIPGQHTLRPHSTR
jgi:DNA-binding NtrC family response regulator